MSLRSRLTLAALLLPLAARPADPPSTKAAPAPAAAVAPAAPAGEATPAIPVLRLKVPLLDEGFAGTPIARVEGETILMEDFYEAIQQSHQMGGHTGPAKGARRDYAAMLDRLVNVRLVVAETRAMGLDELPDSKEALEGIRDRTMIKQVQAKALKDVAADPKVADRLFKEAVREWNLRSVIFPDQAAAKQFAAAATTKADFKAACVKVVADKKALGGEASGFVKPAALAPQVMQAVGKLEKGQVAPPVQVDQGWTVIQLEDVRWPEDARALELARAQALGVAQTAALKKALDGMMKRYVVRNDALVKQINFDAPPGGPEAIEKDKRVVARVKGGTDVTVGELAKALHGAIYHGVADAQKSKRIDKNKFQALDGLLTMRVLKLEAARLGIPETREYKKALRDGENAYLFGSFVSRVVAPEVEVKPEEEQAWYDAHKADYTYPAFYKLDAVGFLKVEDAQAAAAKLRQGTDLKFLRANADGQVPSREARLKVDGSATTSAASLPEGVAKALEGARAGDVRVLSTEGQHYAVLVVEATPPRQQPIDEVRPAIKERVFGEALSRSVEDWFKKLRAGRTVEIYLEQLGG
jgi:parvulin-like peptidyl-prolyl isomerase